jgi:ATP synthase F1 delta subunit
VNYRSADTIIAKKYAQAFISVFPQGVLFADLGKLENAQKFLQTHKKTLFFLQLPQFTDEIRLSMVEDLIGYFSLPHHLSKIFLLLIEHDRSYFIPDVLYYIIQLYKERADIVDFSVISSHELSEKNRVLVKHFLAKLTGKTVMCAYTSNTALIAGMRLQSVEYMWEYSVREQIESLRSLKKVGG